ncbi:VWA domain-containing protein [Pendulispora albinea]|uniref:VWA domain-containing protein n=1 Tax=Pendulispora albinea TaxID=2741071 RepID=A0ABZ2M5B0_9BACT
MVQMQRLAWAALALLASAASSGCGVVGSVFGSDDDDGNGGSGDGNAGIGGEFGGKPSIGGLGDLEACATAREQGSLRPVNLIVMFDKSGSMGDGTDAGNNYSTRWAPVSKGMSTFFSDPKSAGLSASLQYFPIGGAECNASTYTNPAVPRTALPSRSFETSIGGIRPGGDTPTRGALEGAIATAKSTLASRPQERAVIILVTDGQPTACGKLPDVYATAKAGFEGTPSVPTYVVGVGPDTGNLDDIAKSGGTASAIYVAASADPAKTTADLLTQLDKIRGQVASCSFTLPRPPNGKELDIRSVNVVLTPAGGKPTTMTYNSSCDGGQGWHYDHVAAPKSIELCPATCDSVKNAKGSTIQIAFGCALNGKIN